MINIRVCVVGYGNVGREAVECIRQAPDMELAGVARRTVDGSSPGLPAVTRVGDLDRVDAAILALPSRLIPEAAPLYLGRRINTVDGYDIHGEAMLTLRKTLKGCVEKKDRNLLFLGTSIAIFCQGCQPHKCPYITSCYTKWHGDTCLEINEAKPYYQNSRCCEIKLDFGHRNPA